MTSSRNEPQHVMPRWLTYRDAVVSGELGMAKCRQVSLFTDPTLDGDWRNFQEHRSPLLASDLLGRTRALGQAERAEELAKFILDSGSCHAITRRLAERVLGKTPPPPPEEVHAVKIHKLRKQLRSAPNNPTAWIDLARLYAVLHQDDHATNAIRTALGLAPLDRFCLRAAARFFIHIDEKDEADRLFRNRSSRLHDPWVHATAASVAFWAAKPSLLPKKAAIKWLLEHSSFDSSELLEAIGMEEFMSGSDRVAKKAIRAALEHPASNAVAHAEWITRTFLSGLRDAVVEHSTLSKPALTHSLFEEGRIKEAEIAAEEWILEEPYSSAPLVQASYLASIQENYQRVVEYSERASKCRPIHPMLINNTAFALLQMGEIDTARELLNRIPVAVKNEYFAFIATEGLLQIKLGDAAAGRERYETAYEIASSKDPSLKNRVRLHKLLALAEAGALYTKEEIVEHRELAAKPELTAEKMLLERIKRILDSKGNE